MLSQKYMDFSQWIVYQIYPRSFMDSNCDGVGDLCGIIQKLDYITELGANAIWICPCFKSPNVDNGYDISDYRDIMDEFGTMEDMKELIAQAHARGIKVILDLVPNHTSNQHKWFLESKKSKDNPYSDYYYWFDEPITDWKACFGGSAWEYCEERGQYYLHSYAVEQPDLNWTNPKVVKEMQDVVDFWVDMGVDGFRCDVIDQISKDFNGENWLGPHLHEYIHALFGREKTAHLFTVGECFINSAEEFYKHSASERGELTTLFQFEHMSCGWGADGNPRDDKLVKLRDILLKWQTVTNENDLLYTLFSDNHDRPWFLSRMGDAEKRYESATCIATMLYTLRGVPFIYQGQEYGTMSPRYDSVEYFDDIQSVNKYYEEIETLGEERALERMNFNSRDNARHPMCWNGEENGGFSTMKPWLVPHSDYKNVNLESDKASEKSVFKFYQKLLRLRSNSPAILHGALKVLSKQEDAFWVFEREYEGKKMVVICNFEQESFISTPESAQLLLSNYAKREGAFKPYEIAVYKIA